MKSKTLLIACALTAATFSFNAFSQESKVCADPMKRICTDTTVERAQRDAYIKKLKAEISDEATKNAAPRIAEMKKKVGPLHIISRFFQTMKISNQEIMASAKKRIGGIETVVTNPQNIALLKTYMNQAINESRFDDKTKELFKTNINSIVIGNFADYLERTGLEDDVMSQLLGNACGSDGMVANAFATTIKGQRYVLICPGFLITLSQTASNQERLDTIIHAISHEMGHHIDNSKVGNDLYQPYLSCLSDNYSSKFNKTKADQKFCDKKSTDADECNAKVTLTHAGELIADQWGIKVTAIRARDEGYTIPQTDKLLTETWSALCPSQAELDGKGTSDEGIHPTGAFRIGTLMRLNPDISDYLSCNNSAVKKPACTLDGAVNL